MNFNSHNPDNADPRYSATRLLHHVDFFCRAPKAKTVSLAGDFNNWDQSAHPMQRMQDGCWHLQIEMRHGHHQYVFIVDGQPMLDPQAQGTVHRPKNLENPPFETVSLIAVS
jgi:1,4-alpha-glucan branching enzyme